MARLALLLILLCSCGQAFAAGTLWTNSSGSVIRTQDGSVVWNSNDWWNNQLSQATSDGSGGIVSSDAQSIAVDGILPETFTMTEASSAAEIAAASAFLPEAALYAIVGAGLGSLVWDAANSEYEIPPSTTGNTDPVCSDGSTPTVLSGDTPSYYNAHVDPVTAIIAIGIGADPNYPNYYSILYNSQHYGENSVTYNNCSSGPPLQNPNYGKGQDIPPPELPPYVLPWLQANPGSAPPLAGKEGQSGHPPQSTGPTLSGPPSVSLPPVTTTTSNPDGSSSTQTVSKTISFSYSGPNASGSTVTRTSSSSTPAPTASNPNPTPTPGPTQTTSSPAAPASSQPSNPFTPPTVAIPSVPAVPPGTINLPVPTIDNSTGTCPAPIVLNLGLAGAETMTWDLTPWCTLASNLRPLVLTAASLAAAFLLVR